MKTSASKVTALRPTIPPTELLTPPSGPWKPHAYQKKAVKFLIEHAASALFLDPGLGKTAITLAAFKFLAKRGVARKALIIAPLQVCHNVWPDEIAKWADFHDLTYTVLWGPDKDKLLKEDTQLHIINPDGLEWLLQPEKSKTSSGKVRVMIDRKRFKALGYDTLVLDELARYKNTATNRFKMMRSIISLFQRRWGLTGSPAANGLIDLFGQCYMLDEGNALGKFISHYRSKYFELDYNGFSYNLKEGADQEIYKRLAPLALRMAAEDYLDMPALTFNTIKVELDPKTRTIYDQLEDDLITLVGNKLVSAATKGVALGKCRQLASGAVYLDQEIEPLLKLPKSQREWMELHDEKIVALQLLIDELQGSPLLVAYEFNHDLERLLKILGKDTPYIGKGIAPKRTREISALWNAGKLPLLLGHPQSMGLGMNLQQAGHHVCWFTPTWNYELYDQLNRRVYRQGNKARRVFIHHLVAKGTVDELVMLSLKNKDSTQQTLFKALQDLRKKRK